MRRPWRLPCWLAWPSWRLPCGATTAAASCDASSRAPRDARSGGDVVQPALLFRWALELDVAVVPAAQRRPVTDRDDGRGGQALFELAIDLGLHRLVQRGRGLVEEQPVR